MLLELIASCDPRFEGIQNDWSGNLKTQITVVSIEDGWLAPPSPWSRPDTAITLFFNDDPNRHVCRLQIIHEKMALGSNPADAKDAARRAFDESQWLACELYRSATLDESLVDVVPPPKPARIVSPHRSDLLRKINSAPATSHHSSLAASRESSRIGSGPGGSLRSSPAASRENSRIGSGPGKSLRQGSSPLKFPLPAAQPQPSLCLGLDCLPDKKYNTPATVPVVVSFSPESLDRQGTDMCWALCNYLHSTFGLAVYTDARDTSDQQAWKSMATQAEIVVFMISAPFWNDRRCLNQVKFTMNQKKRSFPIYLEFPSALAQGNFLGASHEDVRLAEHIASRIGNPLPPISAGTFVSKFQANLDLLVRGFDSPVTGLPRSR